MFTLGNHSFDKPVFLAPMSGVSDEPFRRMVHKYGADMMFSEMIASRPMLEEWHRGKLALSYKDEPYPVAAQLAGCEPEVIAEAARLHEAAGAAIIDLNFGCPVKKVVNNFAGSALMKDEPLACEIMKAAVGAVSIPVTVKMRLGWDDKSLNAPRLAKMAEDIGIRMVTVHGRTRCQLYNGTADWKAVRKVREAISLPLIVNGDIWNGSSAEEAMKQSGADGVMVGRAANGRPWVIRSIMDYLHKGRISQNPDTMEIGGLLLDHYMAMVNHYGEPKAIGLARKHIGWYCADLPGADDFRAKINGIKDTRLVMDAIRDYFNGMKFSPEMNGNMKSAAGV
ncbi:MAG: tRNA dihydrouridine synthase DusB [Micavibrio aeruginosavorus]|uniref:tRNA-dihydrouridine synthase n=1 Tax=Micavibrio aeruginosavorus TaxID=349221 RepID=A0A2W5A6Y9_9BACT|nr:MAG: tRNA dihydrouridine synthase DusB [Micavibrio aeruginosavorus]